MKRFALVGALALLVALAVYVSRPDRRAAGEALGATASEVAPGTAADLVAGAATDRGQSTAAQAPASARVGVTAAPDAPAVNPGAMTVRGTVTDLAGTPLPRAKVWTWDTATECDERGEYVLVLTSIGVQPSLYASAPQHVEREQAFTFPAVNVPRAST